MEITVSRKAHFNAAHRLHNKNWSDEKNQKVFGKCNYQNYHGHNYELIVSVTGKINPETGYVIDMGELKKIILSDEVLKESKEIIEDLIVAAHNDAKSKLKKKTTEEISKVTGGIDLPSGFKLPF